MREKKEENNFCFDFNRNFYKAASLAETTHVFDSLARCKIFPKGGRIRVKMAFKKEAEIARIVDEFKNYALFLSIEANAGEKQG